MAKSTDKHTFEKGFKVTNTQARLINIAGIPMKPGDTHDIPDHLIDGVKKSPAYRAKWLQEGSVSMPTPRLIDLSKMDEAQAIKLIAVETDYKVLEAWGDVEKRSSVLSAIATRCQNLPT